MAAAGSLGFCISLLSLAIFLVWFVLSKRPFCRVVCPMGALLSCFNRVSMVRIEVASECDGCATCEANCPMDLDVFKERGSKDCILCLECTRCGHVRLMTPFVSTEEVR
jgi:polyferredoxin